MSITPTFATFTLRVDSFRRLVARFADGTEVIGVTPVRAFPLSAPDEGFALLDDAGHELVWMVALSILSEADQALFSTELAKREFMPEITQVTQVSNYNLPSTWSVETDRGPSVLVLKALEDIRAVTPTCLLIADSYGIHYRIRDVGALDRRSRRILDHFL